MNWSERLSGLDSCFLYLEDRTAHMHLGALSLFRGPAPGMRELRDFVSARLDRLPRYRQRVAFVPFHLGRPVWVDADDFLLDDHLRHAVAPAPGRMGDLERLAGRLLSERLDRRRPPWEMWLIEGLADDQFAILWKVHHCMVDGVAGVQLATALMEPAGAQGTASAASSWTPRAAPGPVGLLADAARELLAYPVGVAREALERTPRGDAVRKELLGRLGPLVGLLARAPRAPETPLNDRLGAHRRYATVSLELDAVRRIGAAHGAKVNDVVLAAIAGALRAALPAAHRTGSSDLRVMVPVNVRGGPNEAAGGNQVSAMFCPLPVGEPDAVARLRAVVRSTTQLKQARQAAGALGLLRLADFVPPGVSAGFARYTVLRWFNAVVTNVPGPQEPLYLLGRRLVSWYPFVPLVPGQRLGIAILSYAGALGVGLLGDATAERELDAIARALPAALEELTVQLPRRTVGV